MSYPNIRFPINGRSSRGISPRCSIVRYEIQRVASITGAPSPSHPSSAPVGQASTHREQLPQRFSAKGSSYSSSNSTRSEARKK
jgi:hypothetical protein